MNGGELAALCRRLRGAKGMQHKGDIAIAYRGLGSPGVARAHAAPTSPELPCRVGDDCAAIPNPDGSGYSLLAIEGLLDEFVHEEPWFAGYCGVMVNLSDVAAMGGRPIAVVDALWTAGHERAEPIWAGMSDAARAYGVPIVGGHTNARSDGDRLAVAVFGRANALLTSFDALPGDVLLAAYDLRGAFYGPYAYWNCSTTAPPERLRADLEILPELAEAGLCRAAKDISMGGLLGTLLMLMECSRIGATVALDRVPKAPGAELERWLGSFPSYGFLLAVAPANVAEVRARFRARDLACEPFGTCSSSGALHVTLADEEELFWNLASSSFTGVASYATT